ncbi:mevalonate kinase [Aquimarina sp. 2201CG5-10]|uniref:mevalonate kinase family protein n=1 Tax=Aquimarina callyspongiae TaxID=3098150 RepID=UPI002AB34130|nr:galactokinase family protein [Aquimarina sp. 2201CG5-10]MDY8134167.1 galactokinase family protein [Aquimarina sp. 2201CG5-10]
MKSSIEKDTIVSLAPGRTCLFGDHQDYLGLPVIACAINRHIKLIAIENNLQIFNIKKPDIQKERVIDIYDQLGHIENGDHLLSALKVLRRYGCIPNQGYDITISGDLPINAGVSSSSAVVIAWVQFLIEAFGINGEVTPEYISRLAQEAEVLEHRAPGGKMDQYSIGLGKVIYLETGNDFSYERIDKSLKSLIIAESGIPKQTTKLLKEKKENAWLAIHKIKEKNSDFDIKKAKKEQLKEYSNQLPDRLIPYLFAAISNHDITKKALIEFKKKALDIEKIGRLMNEHHQILRDVLQVSLPKIDNMIKAALDGGAYGGKIVGSGKGGSIVVLAPEGKEEEVINEIIKAGAKNAYQVTVDSGARILKTIKQT